MFATLEASGKPVALLPTSATSYELVNPENGERVKVNAEVAASLSPFAMYFYRPFPDGPLNAKALFHFGRRGLMRDFLRIGVIASLAGILGTLSPCFLLAKFSIGSFPVRNDSIYFNLSLDWPFPV